jgi:methylphosphotriester-DNA--protein-cysteine methyltransferase
MYFIAHLLGLVNPSHLDVVPRSESADENVSGPGDNRVCMSPGLPTVNVDLSGVGAEGAAHGLAAVLPVTSPELDTAHASVSFRCRLIGDTHVQVGSIRIDTPWRAPLHPADGYLMLWAPGPGLILDFGQRKHQCAPAVPSMVSLSEVQNIRATHPTLNLIRFDAHYLESVAGNHLGISIGPLQFTRNPEPAAMLRLHELIRSAAPALLHPSTEPAVRESLNRQLAAAALRAFRATARCDSGTAELLGVMGQAQTFIANHLTHPLTVTQIAEGVGVNIHDLQVAFHRHGDTTPMAYLRQTRLFRVRAELRTLPGGHADTIPEVAARWGFAHYGHFTAAYEGEFGEHPETTIRSRKRPTVPPGPPDRK